MFIWVQLKFFLTFENALSHVEFSRIKFVA
jgi:hypothetical protein